MNKSFEQSLLCIFCGKNLTFSDNSYVCISCGKNYRVKNGLVCLYDDLNFE